MHASNESQKRATWIACCVLLQFEETRRQETGRRNIKNSTVIQRFTVDQLHVLENETFEPRFRLVKRKMDQIRPKIMMMMMMNITFWY